MSQMELVLLPVDQWVSMVAGNGDIYVAAHSHGGYLYWHRVPDLGA